MQLVKHKLKTYEVHETPLGQVLKEHTPAELPNWPTLSQLNFPRIPYELFLQIAKWQTEIALEHKSESATSLFLVNGEWKAICFNQENKANSMTIDVDFEEEENAKLLAEVADKSPIHATLHNHVNGGAGQSGTDFKDEQNLFGPHITIGNLNVRKMTFHARLSVYVNGKHEFIQLHFCDIIDVPVPPYASVEQLDKIADVFLDVPRNLVEDYPEEWKDRFKLEVTKYKGKQVGFSTVYEPDTTQEDYELDAWREHYANKKKDENSGGNDSIVQFSQAVEKLPIWPNEVVFCLDFTNEKVFKESLMNAPAIVEEAAIACCLRLKLSYEELRQHLKAEADKAQTN